MSNSSARSGASVACGQPGCGTSHGHLDAEEAAFLDKYEGQWVKVERGDYFSFQGRDVLVGRVVGWHWYDGVVLHVQPRREFDWEPEPRYEVAFQFDKITVLGPLASAPPEAAG